MATFVIKRKSYADLKGNIIGYTGSMPIYDNSKGIGQISSTTIANTAQLQKERLEIIKQREKIEHEREMELMKMEQERQKQQEDLAKVSQEQRQKEQEMATSKSNMENASSTPNPKLLNIGPKPIAAIPMNK